MKGRDRSGAAEGSIEAGRCLLRGWAQVQARMITKKGLPPSQLKMMRARAISLLERGMDGCCVGEGGKRVAAGHEGFSTHGTTPTEKIDGCETNHGSGMWARPQCVPQTVARLTADGATSFNRSRLDNDCVEHGQCNVDVGLTL